MYRAACLSYDLERRRFGVALAPIRKITATVISMAYIHADDFYPNSHIIHYCDGNILSHVKQKLPLLFRFSQYYAKM